MINFIKGDKAALNIFGFFAAKGLLLVEGIPKKPMAKLNIKDIMRVGLEIEPRVLEVLPAALLHFPCSFTNHKLLPDKVAIAIDHIKRREKSGADLAEIKYADMRRWANIERKDNRVVPVDEKQVMKSVRLRKSTLRVLSAKAKSAKVTETEMIERLITGKND